MFLENYSKKPNTSMSRQGFQINLINNWLKRRIQRI